MAIARSFRGEERRPSKPVALPAASRRACVNEPRPGARLDVPRVLLGPQGHRDDVVSDLGVGDRAIGAEDVPDGEAICGQRAGLVGDDEIHRAEGLLGG
jgi:hypothetical protein